MRMKCSVHNLEVMGSNPGRAENEVHSTSVFKSYLDQTVLQHLQLCIMTSPPLNNGVRFYYRRLPSCVCAVTIAEQKAHYQLKASLHWLFLPPGQEWSEVMQHPLSCVMRPNPRGRHCWVSLWACKKGHTWLYSLIKDYHEFVWWDSAPGDISVSCRGVGQFHGYPRNARMSRLGFTV